MESVWDVGEREFWSPLDYFKQYYNDEFWELIATQTNIRALQETNSVNLKTNTKEIKQLVGASIVAGCLKLPRLRLYYRNSLRVPAVTQLSQDRFFKLRNYLHFVDNLTVSEETKKTNRVWKVEPIIQSFKKKSTKLPFSVNLSIDEQIIPFHGSTVLRQFVKGKPNPVGLKNFILSTPDGLVIDFIIYEGAKTWPGGHPDPELGVGGTIVKNLVANVPAGHTIFIDRYFTSLNLFEYLREEKSMSAVGPILVNRMNHSLKSKVKSDKEMKKKQGRGVYQELVREDSKVGFVKWYDNRPVNMLTTKPMATPVENVRRYDKSQKKYILVPRPNVVGCYNNSMGGVDLIDRLIAYYRMSMRTRKWPVRFLFHFIDMAITKSWVEYKKDRLSLGESKRKLFDLLEFKLYIGEALAFASSGTSSKRSSEVVVDNSLQEMHANKRNKPVDIPNKDVRQTGNEHLPICSVTDKNKFMRCRNKGCSGKTRFMCVKCNIYLCIAAERQCFFEFHTT